MTCCACAIHNRCLQGQCHNQTTRAAGFELTKGSPQSGMNHSHACCSLSGCRLRLGNCRLRRPASKGGVPQRLLPTAELAVEVQSLEAAAALFPQQPAFVLSQVIPSAKLPET